MPPGRSREIGADAARVLELLQSRGTVTVVVLREAGVAQPAQALYELQLAGYPVLRKGGSWKLSDGSEPVRALPEPPPRVRRLG